ncbi:hypothetical protein ES703_103853 [subsurface metagenome]
MTMSLLLTPRIIHDISTVEHHWHSRFRVYPQVVTDSIQLSAGTPADTFGDWTQIIPVDIVPFCYDVIGLVIEQVSVAAVYHIQLGHSPTTDPPGANYEIGERRVKLTTVPIAFATELLVVRGQDIPANSSFWGRLKTDTGNADTADISIVLTRHVEISSPIPKWGAAFPW